MEKMGMLIKKLIEDEEVSGVVLSLIEGDKKIKSYQWGDSFIGKEKSSLNEENKFRVASISKLVTTVGLMKLVDKGLISLDDDISEYLGFELRNPKYKDITITVRMLLSHTSSIRDAEYYTAPMPSTMVDFFFSGGQFYEKGNHFGSEKPGEYFTYSNLNFGIIASIIEVVSNKRFDIYMREEVFEPLEIKASYNVRDFGSEIDKVGVIYRKEAEKWISQVDDYRGEIPATSWYTYAIGDNEIDDTKGDKSLGIDSYVLGSNGTLFSPHGGLRISAIDLARIAELMMNRDEKLLSKKSIMDMEKIVWEYDGSNGNTEGNLMCRYGSSIHYLTGKYGDTLFDKEDISGYRGHTGQAYGLLSGMFYNPEESRGFVYYITGSGRPLEEVKVEGSGFYSWEKELGKLIEYHVYNTDKC